MTRAVAARSRTVTLTYGALLLLSAGRQHPVLLPTIAPPTEPLLFPCTAITAHACQPQCANRQCGPDTCGGSCGECGSAAPYCLNNGTCVPLDSACPQDFSGPYQVGDEAPYTVLCLLEVPTTMPNEEGPDTANAEAFCVSQGAQLLTTKTAAKLGWLSDVYGVDLSASGWWLSLRPDASLGDSAEPTAWRYCNHCNGSR